MAINGHSLLLVLLFIQICCVLSDASDCNENEFEGERGKCVQCRECGPGQELSKDCGYGEGGDAQCVACSSRRYKTNWGHNHCIPCLLCSLINRSQKLNCTTQADAVCGECLLGFYSKTRIGGLKEQECIPCTPLTSPVETECHRKEPMKIVTSTPPPRDMTALLVGASSALVITALAVVILSTICCRRFLKSQWQHAFLRSPKVSEPRVVFASCEAQSMKQLEKRPAQPQCCSKIQGALPDASDSTTSNVEPCSLPCRLPSDAESNQPPRPNDACPFLRHVSETQPLIRYSGSSDCSAGCAEIRRSPTGDLETFAHHPMSATVSCASEQVQYRWSHAPVECTELDLERFSMAPEVTSVTDLANSNQPRTREMEDKVDRLPQQLQDATGFQQFRIENGVNEFQSLVSRISRITQGVHLGQVPQALVLLLSLRLDPHLPGVRNYMDLGTELGVPCDLLSQMSGYGHLHAYLSSSSLCTVPGLIQALHSLQRFDALSLICGHFMQDQDVGNQRIAPTSEGESTQTG